MSGYGEGNVGIREVAVCNLHLVMNLFRRATSEAAGTLGINIPTALVVFSCVGLTVIVDLMLPSAEDKFRTGIALWLFKSIAWLVPSVVIFVLLLGWNILKVRRRDHSVSASLDMAAKSASSKDEQMKSFLRNALRDPHYGVAKCYAFGSVVGQHPTRDVDIIVQFESSEQRPVRTYRARLREVERNFREFYRTEIHLQTFLFAEDEALNQFLDDTGAHERIM